MEIYQLTTSAVGDGSSLPAGASIPAGLSVAIGFFDGVHLGHADVIRRAVAFGRERGQVPAVMTFDPHPRMVLGKGPHYQTVLTPLEDKLALLADLGVEAAYVIRFDTAFASVTAERFVKELLLPLGVRTAVVGFDFSFGHQGKGNAEAMRTFGEGAIDVRSVEPIRSGGDKVSSTRIRDELAAGNCAEAARLLGRPYAIRGQVVHGKARGRTIGFPTANVQPEQPYVIPRTGVYAVTAEVAGTRGGPAVRYGAVLNVGYRPTFELPSGGLSLEAHLFDFEGDLYGRELTLTFREYLRDEKKFASVDELVGQIRRDAERAKDILRAMSLG
ncbi:bifunctional riboflavin kinase/FAD synthetase [Cohnella caldifontis]|uniref:bifunctional riboflavin kinase/FAD synthetase n=1 Tax=Cohnella caldifontis TaxID=3027471 RepID=UPI0023EDFC8A|nr:bifunctional riboflavin kinase/FAD synthetase [Cohnella sp. YIM B05605]